MSLIDDVIASYSRPKPTFTITLPKGEAFEFRHFTDADDFDSWTASAVEFTRQAEAGFKGPMAKFKFKNVKIAAEAHLISYLSVKPKISQLDALRLTATPEVFKHLYNGIERERAANLSEKADQVIEEKKGD